MESDGFAVSAFLACADGRLGQQCAECCWQRSEPAAFAFRRDDSFRVRFRGCAPLGGL